MYLANATAHEGALLCGDQYVAPAQRAFAHHDAVIEGAGRVELGQMRADQAATWTDEFAEATGVQQAVDTLARIGFVIAALGHADGAHVRLPLASVGAHRGATGALPRKPVALRRAPTR